MLLEGSKEVKEESNYKALDQTRTFPMRSDHCILKKKSRKIVLKVLMKFLHAHSDVHRTLYPLQILDPYQSLSNWGPTPSQAKF